jgi:effector-binding domain-containing protein
LPGADVRIETVQPRLIAAVRVHTTLPGLPAAIRTGLDQVWPQIKDRSGFNVVLYHPSQPDGLGPEFDIETGVEVPSGFEPQAPLYLTHTPGGRVVTATHWGAYSQMMDAYRAIEAYRQAHSLRFKGPSWEVYGHHSDDPAKLRTEVFFPLA